MSDAGRSTRIDATDPRLGVHAVGPPMVLPIERLWACSSRLPMTPAYPSLRSIASTERLRISTFGSTVLHHWRAHPIVDDLLAIERNLQRHLEQWEQGFSMFSVVSPSQVRPLEAAAQKESVRVSRIFDRHTLGHGLLIEGEGFVAAAARMIVSTVNLLSSSRAPSKVFDDTPTAARWLAEKDPHVQPEALGAAIETFLRTPQ